MKCSDFCHQNVQSYLSNNPRIPTNKQHFNLTCPLTSPYPTQKKHSKQHDLSHLTEKNRSNINLAVKVFTHPHSSFPNSYIFLTPGLKLHGLIDSTPMVFQPTFQSWTTSDSFGKKFPAGPPWLPKLSRHSLSFAAPESSTPPPARGEKISKISKLSNSDGRDGTGWCFFLFNNGEMMGRLQKCRLFQKSRAFC